jgi:uncharacterized protein (DUF4415 family)
MSVTVTLSFATIAEAASFLSGKPSQPAEVQVAAPASKPAKQNPAPASTPAPEAQTPAPSAPTAEAEPAAAPAEKPQKALDFDTDVVEALRAYSKAVEPAVFKEFMAKLKVAKVNDLKSKPEMWAAIVAHCKA